MGFLSIKFTRSNGLTNVTRTQKDKAKNLIAMSYKVQIQKTEVSHLQHHPQRSDFLFPSLQEEPKLKRFQWSLCRFPIGIWSLKLELVGSSLVLLRHELEASPAKLNMEAEHDWEYSKELSEF